MRVVQPGRGAADELMPEPPAMRRIARIEVDKSSCTLEDRGVVVVVPPRPEPFSMRVTTTPGKTEGCIHPARQLPRRSSHSSTSLCGSSWSTEAFDNGEGGFGEVAPAVIDLVVPLAPDVPHQHLWEQKHGCPGALHYAAFP